MWRALSNGARPGLHAEGSHWTSPSSGDYSHRIPPARLPWSSMAATQQSSSSSSRLTLLFVVVVHRHRCRHRHHCRRCHRHCRCLRHCPQQRRLYCTPSKRTPCAVAIDLFVIDVRRHRRHHRHCCRLRCRGCRRHRRLCHIPLCRRPLRRCHRRCCRPSP